MGLFGRSKPDLRDVSFEDLVDELNERGFKVDLRQSKKKEE
jgi:hypothetical protein